ncbi:MAG: SOS response-associated peptidase [Thermoactinomyces sp.]
MCGRFSLATELTRLMEKFRFILANEISPHYNIAPSQTILTVTCGKDGRVGKLMKWGLVPYWAKDPKIGCRMINARAETLAEKPAYKIPFRKQRCLIPADGFYEWKKLGEKKQPYRYQLKNGEPFAFAGLWDRWKQGNKTLYSCTIITVDPNPLVNKVHNRMPLILPEDAYDLWLSPNAGSDCLQTLFKPYPEAEMEAFPVSSRVNSPRNDDPSLVEPVDLT